MDARARHRRHLHHAVSIVSLLLFVARAALVYGDCSLGAGSTLYRHESRESDRVPVVSFGCELQKLDVRARYFARQHVTRERPWGSTQYLTNAHVALSIMRIWNVHPRGRLRPVLGAGIVLKASDAPRNCELVRERPGAAPYTACKGNPWAPLPLEFSLMGALAGEHWSLAITHVSNAYLHSYNWGQNSVEIGYRW